MLMNQMPDYYKSSDSYAEMLQKQSTEVFTPYINLFKQFASQDAPVLDVGCGVGTSTLLLRQFGFSAVGTDVSKKFLPADLENFYEVDFQNAKEISSNTYAAVGTFNVIEHVERPQDFLLEMIRVAKPGGHIILLSPNLTSPLTAIRIILDLLKRRTPYLGINSLSEAVQLFSQNLWRSIRADLGQNAFESRSPILNIDIVGYDADAVYWTNAKEIKRFFEAEGCEICLFQKQGRSLAALAIAYLLPGFAGQLCIVARKKS